MPITPPPYDWFVPRKGETDEQMHARVCLEIQLKTAKTRMWMGIVMGVGIFATIIFAMVIS